MAIRVLKTVYQYFKIIGSGGITMAVVCPSSSSYPAKPSYNDFWNSYHSLAGDLVPWIGTSISFILVHWFSEWGIPINNPAFQTSTEGYASSQGKCGNFPIFDTLQDGAYAYKELMERRYVLPATAYSNIFGDKNNVNDAYMNGFASGKTATNVLTDSGTYKSSVSSVQFKGRLESGGTITSGTYAANEALGASAWNAGHYMLSTDTYPGAKLNRVLDSSGWAAKEAAL
ncbi:hypothetical protein [Cohnella sp. AR92]|uniref:hypothetical protein n=1 Tax=Cohnella sp. AR92 TaxID=648716 RepID=UPI000F8E68C5|nr:hypothetical protein [Cohnella sp. AR92]RUS46737.1 hypothetical protein ELR57_13650 [Cohnella sp. AR92]